LNFCFIYNKYSEGRGGLAPLILYFSIRLREWSISRYCSIISEDSSANNYLLTYLLTYLLRGAESFLRS